MDYVEYLANQNFEKRVADIRVGMDRQAEAFWERVDAEDDGIVERAQMVLDHTLVVTSTAVPQLLPKSWVEDLTEDLEALKVAVDALVELEDVSKTAAASFSSAVDAVAHELAMWPAPTTGDWRSAISEAATTYRRSAGQQLAALRSDIDAAGAALREIQQEAKESLATIQDANAAQHEELAARIAQLNLQVGALDTQRAAIADQVARSAERADQAISTFQLQFSDAQDARAKEFQAGLAQMTSQANAARVEAVESAERGIEAINAKVSEAGDLVSVFAAAGTANAYSKEAKEQAKLANGWRLAAIALAMLAGLAAVTLLFADDDAATNWSLIIGKLALAGTLGGLASYAARQSARHRGREERARHLELNIVTTGPLLLDVDESKQTEARLKVVEAMLQHQSNGPGSDKSDRAITDDQINMIGRLFEIARRSAGQ